MLFLVGMATTETRWWARGLWLLIGVGVIVEAVFRVVQHKRATSSDGVDET